MNYKELASEESINKTKAALEEHGFVVFVVSNGEQAKQKALELIPENTEVMTMTSVTLDTIGLAKEINESSKRKPTRAKLMDSEVSGREKKRLGAAPEYTVGSVHAVTEDGKVIIASNTGSQLGAYSYGADHVIWVVGTQKITENLDTGLKRVYDYVLPLESVRANKAYNITTGSNVRKLLIFNSELTPNRITIILVKEILGF